MTEIIDEELSNAKQRILERIVPSCVSDELGTVEELRSFPNNEKYEHALALYKQEKNHSLVARSLGVSINAAKKYYIWLVINGYLPTENVELSEAEKKVVDCICRRKMSLNSTAQELGCSITNITRRRDSALSKGYCPDTECANNNK